MKSQFSKKIILILITVVFCFGMCACESSEAKDYALPSLPEFDDYKNPGTKTVDSGNESFNDTAGASKNSSVSFSANKNSSASNSSSKKSGETSEIDFGYASTPYSDGGFTAVSIPSRKNAYKLSNTYGKIKSGQSVKVLYYGGSVTNGSGASEDARSWRMLTTAYLKTLSTGSKYVTEINRSVGGTGTYFGAARFEHDVIAENPDLLIIEFAINDVYSGITAEQSKANLEYMIRKLNAKNPYADIIIALVPNKSTYGGQYKAYKAHLEVANYYNIPVVDFGGEMYNRTEGSYDGFADSVHPNDAGHKIYAAIMTDALKELFTEASRSAHALPATPLCTNGYSTLKNTLASNISAKNWSYYTWFNNTDYEKSGSPFRSSFVKNQFPGYIAPIKVGETITFSFTGNSFGFLGTVKDGATLRFTLDNSDYRSVNGTTNTGLLEYPVYTGLTNTSHTVTVTVQGNNPYVAIAAFVTTE